MTLQGLLLRWSAAFCLALVGGMGCATAAGAHDARRYLQALEERRWEDAYRETSSQYRQKVSKEQFVAEYADNGRRLRHVQDLELSLQAVDTVAPELSLSPSLPPEDTHAARTTVEEFARAVQNGRFSTAYVLLAAALRARYTPETLERDFTLEPSARARLERALLATQKRPWVARNALEFPLGGGGAVALVREGGAWRLSALE